MKNIIALFKTCGRLSKLLGHPYFVEFTCATNYEPGDAPDSVEDPTYATLHFGRYHDEETKKLYGIDPDKVRLPPMRKMYFFGPVGMILNLRAVENFYKRPEDLDLIRPEYEEESNWAYAQTNIEQFRKNLDNFFKPEPNESEAQKRLRDYQDSLIDVMAETCADSDDRKHCTCVPLLKLEVRRLRQLAIDAQTVLAESKEPMTACEAQVLSIVRKATEQL